MKATHEGTASRRPPRKLIRWLATGLGAALAAVGFVIINPLASAAVSTDTWYNLVNQHSGMALDIEGASSQNGAQAVQWNSTGGANQQFKFLDSGDGYYRIQARHSGLVLDVYAKSTENGADIVQWADNNGTNQQWSVTENGDGTVMLVNRNSGKALDNWERSTTPGTRVSQYDQLNNTAQRWELVPADGGPSQDGDGSPDDSNIQYYGRWNTDSANTSVPGWAGAYLETGFTGTSIGVRQGSTVDLYYSIDGAPERWLRGVSGNVSLATGLSAGQHTVRIGYRELAGSYTGDVRFNGLILASGAETVSISRPAKHIEFIGDSITVGQPNGDRPFNTYGWMAAEALGASHMQVAEGGACVSTTECRGMVEWFQRTDNQDYNNLWDFSTYDADLVVVNLGTNNKVSSTEFQADYVLLLERVREAWPDAEILAMGVFRERLLAEVQNAVSIRNDAGDAAVHYVDTVGWVDPGADTHDNVHPTDAGQAKIAGLITPVLEQYL